MIKSCVDWENRPPITDMPLKYFMNTLSTQYSVLKRMNELMPDGVRVPEAWFEDPAIKFIEPNDEDLNNFFFYFVQKETFQSTLEYNIKLLRTCLEGRCFIPEWIAQSPIQPSELAAKYQPGIHIIRTNLIEGWVSDMPIETPNAQIFEAIQDKSKMIGVEAFSLFALQNKTFLKKFDGRKYPKYNLLGLQIDNIGCIPTLSHGLFSGKITLTMENIFYEGNQRIPLKILYT